MGRERVVNSLSSFRPSGDCKEEIMERKTVSIMQACEIAGVSRRTIYNWLNAGKLEYRRTVGGAVRIVADSLWAGSEVQRISWSKADEHASHSL